MVYGIYSNSFQGDFKKVLCVCSAGLLRSPTIAHTLSAEPFNYNTRIAGCAAYALTPVTDDLLEWADEIVCADKEHEVYIKIRLQSASPLRQPKVVNLGIPDEYAYRDPELIEFIVARYTSALQAA